MGPNYGRFKLENNELLKFGDVFNICKTTFKRKIILHNKGTHDVELGEGVIQRFAAVM